MLSFSKKFVVFIVILFGIFYVSNTTLADSEIGTQDEDIVVSLSPKTPEPYQDVSVSLSSYATDLNKATISWKENGKTVLSGIGKTTYSFKTSGPGVRTTITVSVRPSDSIVSINKTITINPSEVELLWESVDGYTPPFYKGKTLGIRGSSMKVVAIPSTSSISSGIGNMSYTWKNNGEVNQNVSGYNKNTYTFKGDLFDGGNEITVSVSSVDGKYSAEKTLSISSYDPEIIFYKKSPTEGVLYNNGLKDNVFMGDSEFTLVAEPYFLPINSNTNYMSYAWKINGNYIETPRREREMTLRPSSRGGYATINLSIENISKLFQKVVGNLKISL